MANVIVTDMKESVFPAERIADGLLVAMREHDPVEVVCALAMVASHYIVTVGTEGGSSVDAHRRLQLPVQKQLLERVTELCQQVRQAGAN